MEDNKETARTKLRSELKKYHGSINEIAHRRGCTREWVRLVLRDEGNDDQILIIASQVLRERREARKIAEETVVLALTA